MGFTGEPVTFRRRSGARVSMNSYRPRWAQAVAKSSRLALSISHRPRVTKQTVCNGFPMVVYRCGRMSLEVSVPIMAIPRSLNQGVQPTWQAVIASAGPSGPGFQPHAVITGPYQQNVPFFHRDPVFPFRFPQVYGEHRVCGVHPVDGLWLWAGPAGRRG